MERGRVACDCNAKLGQYPDDRTGYLTLREALDAAQNSPRALRASAETSLIRGALVLAGRWTDDSLVLYLSNKRTVKFFLAQSIVGWCVEDHLAPPLNSQQDEYPLELDFLGPPLERFYWNRAGVLGRRLNRQVQRLSATPQSVFLYVDSSPILLVSRLIATDTGRLMLFWDDSD